MKPDWKDAPEWAKWCAMDENGLWSWFETKPVDVSGEWLTIGPLCGRASVISHANWRDTLEERPNAET